MVSSLILAQLLADGHKEDTFLNQILQMFKDGAKQCKEILLAECDETNSLLYCGKHISVPNYKPLNLHLI
jgi:hypothetical protein